MNPTDSRKTRSHAFILAIRISRLHSQNLFTTHVQRTTQQRGNRQGRHDRRARTTRSQIVNRSLSPTTKIRRVGSISLWCCCHNPRAEIDFGLHNADFFVRHRPRNTSQLLPSPLSTYLSRFPIRQPSIANSGNTRLVQGPTSRTICEGGNPSTRVPNSTNSITSG
jgi:hypothetical protein